MRTVLLIDGYFVTGPDDGFTLRRTAEEESWPCTTLPGSGQALLLLAAQPSNIEIGILATSHLQLCCLEASCLVMDFLFQQRTAGAPVQNHQARDGKFHIPTSLPDEHAIQSRKNDIKENLFSHYRHWLSTSVQSSAQAEHCRHEFVGHA
ncbi:hypothetical protein DEU56DRAFT_452392 [Suillus clintonianus]|uniref:uncharacterized protein n=1 Tax=Suillus clintonianus TaxID=1904413 RepID=UPI001B876F75|nr:uncharacterized protein DEU56DRAFT_452392 [Suillus clintonianus]KAG2131819.1 hypothetical protein DEU56DRAFT_452392 [Suillus clintonianus]